MREYRYALSPTSQFYFCGIPFRLDTTPKCSLNCLYCFAMARGGRRTYTELIATPTMIWRKFDRAFQNESRQLDVVGWFLVRKVPVHFGGMSDPFANKIISQVSSELLEVLADYNYPTVISTKQTNELGRDEIIRKLKRIGVVAIQVSLPTISSEITALLEPNAPSPEDRLKALRLLSDEGFHTIARLQPLLPNQIHRVITELIPKIGEAGIKHVVVEFLKLPVEKSISNIGDLFNALNWDGYHYFHKHQAIKASREWVLPPIYKWDKLQPVISAIRHHGMTYGAGDYGLNHLSDTDCCCGISEIDGFQNWFKSNIAFIIRKSPKDRITFPNMEILDGKSIRMFLNSKCRGQGLFTIGDYLKRKWNHPGTENSPDSFLGIEFKGERDENMNCVYEWVGF